MIFCEDIRELAYLKLSGIFFFFFVFKADFFFFVFKALVQWNVFHKY